MSNITLRVDPATTYLEHVGALETIPILTRVSASISLIGIIAVLSHMSRSWRDIMGTVQRILLWITLADIFLVPAGLMARSQLDSPIGCAVQGVLVQFGYDALSNSQMASAVWGSLHATTVLLSLAFRQDAATIISLEKYFHLVGWGVPFVLTLGPILVANKPGVPLFGDAQLWCWYRVEYSSYRLVATTEAEGSKLAAIIRQRYVLRVGLYFLAFFLTWTFAAINRVRAFALPTAHPLPLVVELHAWFKNAHGFLNCTAYFLPMLWAPLPAYSSTSRDMSGTHGSSMRNLNPHSSVNAASRTVSYSSAGPTSRSGPYGSANTPSKSGPHF
ncbi:hypothetical protein RI367_004333 [Sorochytrium milnesiophthora]